MTPFRKLMAADPQSTRHVIEAAGHVMAHHRGELVTWCRRIGVSIDEFDAIVREYRVGVERGTRSPHGDFW